jgi:hypothetical protein
MTSVRQRERKACLRAMPSLYTVLNRAEAAAAFDLPPDRLGDIVALADESTVLGKSRADQDLAQVPHLRSDRGLDGAAVPWFSTAVSAAHTPAASPPTRRATGTCST